MSGPNGEACGDCYFWEPPEYEDQPGIRYPGWCNLQPKREQKYTENWCGEFKRREESDE